MEKLQIVYLPPGELKPYEKNARPSCLYVPLYMVIIW